MKKFLNILLCAALVCALSACGAQAAPSVPREEPQSGAAAPETQEAGPQEIEDVENAEVPEGPEDAGDAGTAEDPQDEESAAPTLTEGQTDAPAAPADDKTTTKAVSSQPVIQPEKPAEQPKAQPKEQPKNPAKEQLREQPKEPAKELEEQPVPEPASEPVPEPAPEPAPAPAADPKTVAQGLVGRPVSELYAAIGRPTASDYSPSCLVDGEDGELYYNGFTVYTTKEGNSETVYAVM